MKICLVIPVYNENLRLPDFLKTLMGISYPIIFVNDGSTDNSLKLLQKFGKRKSKVIIFSHRINLGKGASLKTGCDYAFKNNFDAVVLMDSDGQHLVSEIQVLATKLEKEKFQVVLGSRNLNYGVPFDRYVGNKIASVLVAILFNIYVSDLLCGFRGITKNAYKKLRWISKGYAVEIETVIRLGRNRLSYCEVPVSTIYYDKFKGVSINEAFGILVNLIVWKFRLK